MSKEEQAQQDIAFEREQRERQRTEKLLDIADGLATVIEILTGH